MKVNVNVIGNLVANAELRTAKNGANFVSFRLACNGYRNGKEETAWFNVIDYNDNTIKKVDKLTKGKLINICGAEEVSIYMDKNNTPQISRSIKSDRIDIVNSSNKKIEEEETQLKEESNVVVEQIDAMPQITCGTLKPQEKIEVAPAQAMTEEDDLPF